MIGSVVGNYKIVEKIGEGGMGAVFKGVDIMLEREVAMKVLRPELAGDPHVVERFRSEAVTLAKLNHPNIATLYSFFRDRDDFFMVMEFVRGETVEQVLQRLGQMSAETAVPLFCQALDGIGHAHRTGIIHRDIKPANLMITHEDSTVKVMDFGIARALGSARMTREGRLVGTIEYMAPEQVKGRETDTRTDVYALGIVLYEMMTGRLPFASDSEYELMRAQVEQSPVPPRDLNGDVPPAIECAIMRALAKVPEARFPTANEFRRELLEFLGISATAPTGSLSATGGLTHRLEVSSHPSGATAPFASGESVSPASSSRSVAKETRIAAAAAGVEPLPVRFVPTSSVAPAVTRQFSWRDLSWKYYALAGSGLFVALAIPLAMLAFGGGTTQAPPPTSTMSTPDTTPSADEPSVSQDPVTGVAAPTRSPSVPVREMDQESEPPNSVSIPAESGKNQPKPKPKDPSRSKAAKQKAAEDKLLRP